MRVCHLVLKHKYYDMIEKGKKNVEYRNNTHYWRIRILNTGIVVFHRGYTNTTMSFGIRFISYNGQIEIHLGKRLRS